MRKRIFAVAALTLATLSSTTSVQTASAAGPTYWMFSDGTSDCLTEYSTGVIRLANCTGGTAQQWNWINSDWNSPYRLLKNRWTGDCLVAPQNYWEDIKSGSCDDWTSRQWSIDSSTATPIASAQGGYVEETPGSDHVRLSINWNAAWWKTQMS
ncbi:hypothetical protein ACIREM_09890 [Streptomyces shenzhenensis]|uniref:hypothetical protein n=1 Tax=Streptomyces shenzhenensis TaxID=943815 RepID=UPI0038303D9C